MTETVSLNQLAKESGRSKAELKKLRQEGILIGEQDKTGNQRFRFIRASAVAAGILPNRAATTHPRHDGTIDTAVRAAIADELQPVIALLTNRIPDIEHTVVGMLPKFLAPAGVWCAARGLECETAILECGSYARFGALRARRGSTVRLPLCVLPAINSSDALIRCRLE